jgi:predicted amidohydrolase YtcJ
MSEIDHPILIRNARAYLFDQANSTTDTILIEAGRIAAVGDGCVYCSRAAAQIEVWDAHGATVLPGLIDTHPHLLHFATRYARLVDITTAVSHEDIVIRIADRAKRTPAGEWIMTTPVGEPHYFIRRSYKDLREGELPTRHVLDRATERHPVAIQAWDPNIPGTVVFNSLALRELEITRDLPDRIGNVSIEKDETGNPTGRLHGAVTNGYGGGEFAYQLWRKIPLVIDSELMLDATRRAVASHHRLGVTAICENHMMYKHHIDVYRRLRESGELNMRVAVSQEADSFGTAWSRPRKLDQLMRGLEDAASSINSADDYLRFNGFSIQWDGGCYPGHMKMRDAYYGPDGEETHGRYMMDPKNIEAVMRFCAERRLRLNTLCVGTQAHEENLRMLESLATEHDIRSLQWILVHTPFIEAEQVRRYARLNFAVTTTMTYLFGMGDLFRNRLKPKLREALLEDLLPLRRFFDAGLAVGAGADWGPKNVFEQIQLALLHKTPSGYSNLGAAQKISRCEALSMWTRDAANVLQWNDIGSLSPGARADLIILDRDPMTCPVGDLPATRMLRTVFDGRTVYDAGDL